MKFLLKIISFLVTCSIYGQASRAYVNSKFENAILEVATTDGKYFFKGVSSEIIETTFIPSKENKNWSSHIEKQLLSPPKINFEKADRKLFFYTEGIKVVITKRPFNIAYYYKNTPLISERKGYIKTYTSEILDFNLNSEEILYGGGSRALPMNRRGHRLELYNKAHYAYENEAPLMNYCMPLVISSKKYMIHFDNSQTGFLDLDSKKDNSLQFETIGGKKTYQVIASDTWQKTIGAYTSFTGRQPLPPRWVFGNFASRFGYHSQNEVTTVVNRFKQDSIPLDAVILDIYWFGKEIKGSMGNLEFKKDSFPTPQKMISDLKKEHIKTVLITEPFILKSSKEWNEAVSNSILATHKNGDPYTYDFYFGTTGLIDIFKPEAKSWFKNIYKKYTKMGIAGWWGDLGEPEVHPEDLYHGNQTANEVHNIYGHQWAKLLNETYTNHFPKQRPFILMRAGYSGSQAYGIIPWSGDVNRSWAGLQAQPKIALQMGLQGLGYMHSDLGGFAGGEVFDSELYTRWLQYGVFQPIFRPHAQEHIAPEPVFHDKKTKKLARKAIELRYNLLPYNYTLAFENHRKGLPLMRPLFYTEPINNLLKSYSDSYLWGNDFLVTPILQPGITEKEIYFPKGSIWYDFYGNKKYPGGESKVIKTHNEYIPTFVKGGAFITQSPSLLNTEKFDISNIELHYYYDENTPKSVGYIYNDDGKTPNAFKKEKFELLNYRAYIRKKQFRIDIENEVASNFTAKSKTIQLKIHNLITVPKQVMQDNKIIPFNWREESKTLTVVANLKAGSKTFIQIKK